MLNGYHIAALCISRIHDEENVAFVSTLNSMLVENGWRLMCFTTDSDLYSETSTEVGELQVYDLLDFDVMDAAIFFFSTAYSPSVKKNIINRVLKAGKPAFIIDDESEGCYSVRFDYQNGFSQVVKHVLGHHDIKDIHFLAGSRENPFSVQREQVMYDLCEEYNIPFGPDKISYGNFWSEPAKQAVRNLIKEHRVPRALICANDSMAVAACNLLTSEGYHVPDDVMITGFDGATSVFYSHPKLTTCICDYRSLAKQVSVELFYLFDGGTPKKVTFVNPKILIQESCGCHSSSSFSATDYLNEQANSFQRYHGESRFLEHLSLNLQLCENPLQLRETMNQNIFYDMICILKKECMNSTLNPLKSYTDTTYGEKLYILYDSEMKEDNYERDMKREFMLPRMNELLEEKRPLVFIGLNYLNIPLGYLCFHFREFNRASLLKVGQIAWSLNAAIGGFRNMQYQNNLMQKVEDSYRLDAVTGLHTRVSFLKQYDKFIRERNPKTVTLVMCDLDDLKHINDCYSHTEGDKAIAVIADALHNACHEGLCCRYGGDEMIAVLTKECKPEDIRQAITEHIDQFNNTSGKPYQVSASIGIYQSAERNLDTLFEEADKIMYTEKQGKKLPRAGSSIK